MSTRSNQNYFLLLDEQEKRDAILRLFRSSVSVHGIASITGVAHAQIIRVLEEGAIPELQK
jgi:DNA invertase Pin-like site-specific DNA recombinase